MKGVDDGKRFRTGEGLKRSPCRGIVTEPEDKVLQFWIATVGVHNFFNIPCFFATDNTSRKMWRIMARNWIIVSRFEEVDVGYWMYFHGGRKIQYISMGTD